MSTVFTPENKDELKNAVLLWINNKRDALERYGNIGGWNTEKITDMSGMFRRETTFNEDIGGWNTSNVTNMSDMFEGAINFNKHIGGWNTSNVTNMAGMFWRATSFNADISGWKTGRVTNMSYMFNEATNFNQDISEWDINNVEYMGGIFEEATDFSYLYSLEGWDIDIPNPTAHDTVGIQDYGEREGVAFEVHNIFRKMNKSNYINHLMTFFNELTPEQRDNNPFIISDSGNLTFDYWDPTKMKTITQVAFNHYIDREKPSEKAEETRKFELVFGRITNCAPSAEVKQIINLSVAYMWTSDWSDDERGLYIYKMISDNAEAYTGDVATLNISCIQGIFERFILGIRDMIQIKTDKTPVQIKLFSIITNQLLEPDKVYELWREEVKENTQYENIKNIISKRDDNEDIVFDDVDAIALQKSYADFMRSKYSVMLTDEPTLNAKMKEVEITQFIDYIPTHIQDGGRKRRKTKKSKKTRKKSKKSKTKKKKSRKSKTKKKKSRKSKKNKN